jgi:hypothetical protein
VNEQCSCGALLPEGARFCHKCGKPQFELPAFVEPAEEERAPAVAPAIQAAGPAPAPAFEGPAPITLRNPWVVKYALICSGLMGLVSMIPLPPALAMLWSIISMAAGGFVAVYFYQRKTGDAVSGRSGARIGFFVGLFYFLMMLVIITLSLAIATSEQSLGEIMKQASQQQSAEVQTAMEQIIASPGALGAVVMIGLSCYFLLVTALPVIGGALAAKVLEKD